MAGAPQSQPPRGARVRDTITGLAVIVILIFGIISAFRELFGLGSWLLTWLTGHVHVPPGMLSAAIEFFQKDVIDQLAVWITAAATVALWIATCAIIRTGNVQAAMGAPFLRVDLAPSGPRQPNLQGVIQPDPAYLPEWGQEDLAHPQLGPCVVHAAPEYVNLTITNEQTAPFGVSGDIRIAAMLTFPANAAGAEGHIKRNVRALVLGTTPVTASVSGPIFNIGGLSWFRVELLTLAYRDIGSKERQAGYGTGTLMRDVIGNVTRIVKIFEPGKRELRTPHG